MKKFLLFFFTLMTLSLVSCHEKEEPDIQKEWPESDHTLLIYMIGDNSLSEYCEINTKACINGLLGSESPVNLVIYEDGKSTNVQAGGRGKPALYRLKRNYENKQKVDTIMIHQFNADHDSSDPEIMQAIINEAFDAFPGTIKGLELWSHGLGWAPSPNYRATRGAEGATRASQYFGQDNSNYLEIWELRKALEKTPHLDYIIFDACNMGQAEVAYELRNVADYMLACPTEIMAAGLPYADLIQRMSLCNDKPTVFYSLMAYIDEFAMYYPGSYKQGSEYVDGGTIALSDLTKMTELHHAFKALLAICDERRQLLSEHAYTYEGELQPFGRTWPASSRYYFYDILSYANFLVNNHPENYPEYATFQKALNSVVLQEYHSEHVLDFKTMHSCGLGVGVPEIFMTAATNPNTLMSAYNQLQWAKD